MINIYIYIYIHIDNVESVCHKDWSTLYIFIYILMCGCTNHDISSGLYILRSEWWTSIVACLALYIYSQTIHINARVMKFISNKIRIMFSRFLALLWFLILKTFNLKYLVGERYKGWISRPLLSVHSSMKYILCLCFELSIPCGEYLFHDATRLNYLVYSGLIKHLVLTLSFAFHAKGVLYHGTPK